MHLKAHILCDKGVFFFHLSQLRLTIESKFSQVCFMHNVEIHKVRILHVFDQYTCPAPLKGRQYHYLSRVSNHFMRSQVSTCRLMVLDLLMYAALLWAHRILKLLWITYMKNGWCERVSHDIFSWGPEIKLHGQAKHTSDHEGSV